MTEILNQRYTILETLAQGSDSRVYRAHDALSDRPVLLKLFLPAAIADWKRFQLIEREAKILAQINHIQIPDFIDFFTREVTGEQYLYLVTEWIKGTTLSEMLASEWRASEAEAMQIADQVLQLLVYIHAFNPPIVHRDIKPSNLMINDYHRVFLVDFGGVQEAMESQGAGGSTLVGTQGYMAPEQLSGRSVPASDLFALGITLLELMTGLPSEQLDPQQTTLDLEKLLPGSDKQWRQWLAGLVAPKLENRYSQAEEALMILDHIRRQDPEKRTLFRPQDHKARLPEILQSLTLIARSEKDDSLKSGSLLEGRYEIQGLLGSGTHSRVYNATDKHNNQPVVIKELLFEQIENWKNLELFEREIAIQKSLSHPKIPEFIDSFKLKQTEEGLCWYLVTQAVAGETLEKRLESGWRPTEESVWHLARQLLDILVYLQGLSPPLVHRDIKPSNIMIDEQNQLSLIDFGAVQERFWSQGGGGSTIIGTFGYMAPEQFSGKAAPTSDLYALGATLLRILSRKHPIEIPFGPQGLAFRPFIESETFYLFWLETCLAPLATERFASAKEALDLLVAHQNRSPLASDWLKQKQAGWKESAGANLVKSGLVMLPPQIPYTQLAPLLEKKSDAIHAAEDQVQIFYKDPDYLQTLMHYESKTIFHLVGLGLWYLTTLCSCFMGFLGLIVILVELNPTLLVVSGLLLTCMLFLRKQYKNKIKSGKIFPVMRVGLTRSEVLYLPGEKYTVTQQIREVFKNRREIESIISLHRGVLSLSPQGIYIDAPEIKLLENRSQIHWSDIHSVEWTEFTPQTQAGVFSEAPLYQLKLWLKNPIKIRTNSNNSSILYVCQRNLVLPLPAPDAQIASQVINYYFQKSQVETPSI